MRIQDMAQQQEEVHVFLTVLYTVFKLMFHCLFH